MEKNLKTLLVTGAAGLIGKKVCEQFSGKYKIIAIDRKNVETEFSGKSGKLITGDISDYSSIQTLCRQHTPDIIIHCAGIAHQSLDRGLNDKLYEKVNFRATEQLALIAVKNNPEVHIIFLSTVSVYGEKLKKKMIDEKSRCQPTSPYAQSKLNAEITLKNMVDKGLIKKLDILRLAPVYSNQWMLNLEKRVFGPKKICYLRFGSGNQAMSVLALSNLIDFIGFRIMKNDKDKFSETFNVCDKSPCTFNEMIVIFKRSLHQPNRIVLKVPLKIVWFVTIILAGIFKNKSGWILSCYDKVSNDLVFDNSRMLEQGFKPQYTITSLLLK